MAAKHGRAPRHWALVWIGALVGAYVLYVLARGGLTPGMPGSGVSRPGGAVLHTVSASRAADLEALFASRDYLWPPEAGVPPLALRRLPSDLDRLRVEGKKALFLRSVLPLVLAENRRIRAERRVLDAWFAAPHGEVPEPVRAIADAYGVGGDLTEPAAQEQLRRRVDVVPPALALAQAAIESGWGTSRFAREGNSLFGQWTWRAEDGIVPAQREEGKRHHVQAFPDLRASVRAYLHNLNTGHAYVELRRLRSAMRGRGDILDPWRLAEGLARYSERGRVYVTEVQAMMRANALVDGLRDVQLASSSPGPS